MVFKDKQLLKLLNIINANNLLDENKDYINFKGIIKDISVSITRLKKKLVKYIFETQVASSRIFSVSEELSITMEENNAFAQQLYAESQEIFSNNSLCYENVENTITEIKKLVEKLENIKNTSGEMYNTGIQSRKLVNESFKEIRLVLDKISNISITTEETLNRINELTKISIQISQILKSIEKIAKETHLLSLNASIESAKAEKYGNGFGVIADGIRKLTLNTNKAVTDIVSLIEKVNNEIENVKKSASENYINVKDSVSSTMNIEKSLSMIEEYNNTVMNMISKIVNVSEDEYKYVKNINEKIESVQNLLKEVSNNFDIMNNSIYHQKENAEKIVFLSDKLKEASNDLKLLSESDEIKNVIRMNFENIKNTAINVIKSIKKEIISDEFLLMNRNFHKEALDAFLKNHKEIEALWTNDIKGRFIYSNPPAGIANANVREWFQKSIKGKEYVSEVYISAITKAPCLTVSIPLIDKNGSCIGVIGADLNIKISDL
ncbi:methyl-accepting chemotaxis protein [Thermoanaerobacterium saccharolyticum]|uniref:Methyl-accepting chemotaxis sensory transducer with Cache sensor n=2 Tax=Thermoanaerobacterium TaxID=28895 RepID=W9EEB3_9THEO|nr:MULTISPECIES: methyl-accepting chemotaxis protein [Thermoanaerobacterium]AFK87215.1 methyl-accepting chemotaxis sensory transducer with Cache sensor [Thermoanaerobacterium saccharolyticum JW/SL-YS485]ETO38099.1 methyl-accepting chemotaxis sensory transducer with Cache sensor [Thermoanaerobacterium aotearoense SCUT27]